MLLCQSVLILVPSILSWPWNPHRSWWGRGGMDIIHCSWSWCVYYIKRPLPLFCVFPSLSLNRIEIKHASVFVKIIFPLHWRFYSVSIWVTRHFGQVILVMPASTLYPPTQHTHTHTALPRWQWWFFCEHVFGETPSEVQKLFGRLGGGWCPLPDESIFYWDRTSLLAILART